MNNQSKKPPCSQNKLIFEIKMAKTKLVLFRARHSQYEPSSRFHVGHRCRVCLSEFSDEKTFSIFGVRRELVAIYDFLVLLEKPASKDKKTNISEQAIMPGAQNQKLLCYSKSKNRLHRNPLYFVTSIFGTENRDGKSE